MVVEYIRTGIHGVDTLLGEKGPPRGHTILVSGGPGSGKTTVAIQFLYMGATQYGESGVYVTLDEEPSDIRTNMRAYGWDLEKLEEEQKLTFINVSPVRITPSEGGLIEIGMKEFWLIKLLEAIKQGVAEVHVARIVIDPISIFTLQYPDEIERIYAVRDLLRELRKTGCTNLLMSELKGTGVERKHQFEEYLTQGGILLRTSLSGSKLTLVFQVTKIRGLAIDNQPRPYEIGKNGIEIHSRATVYE